MAAQLKHNIDRSVVVAIADRIRATESGFDCDRFVVEVMATIEEREMKDRVSLIADTLAGHLPSDYPTALQIVEAAGRTELDNGWAGWPLCSFVERHGLDHPEISLAAMTTLTQRWSCEFAIRPYLEHHLELTRTFMRQWAVHEEATVRRLPSEGSRPLLPWGQGVKALLDDPQIGLEVLHLLYADPSETVRRSVANHLNDVAKANGDLVVAVLRGWLSATPPIDAKHLRHALRTLIKRGHPGALGLLGFTTDPQVTIADFNCVPADIGLGEEVELCVTLNSTSTEEQLLVIDFVVHHVTARGTTSTKVFKWTNQRLEPHATVTLTKRRTIQQATTRTYHAGIHRIDLQVAGRALASTQFNLGT